jgi:hypothetical protein
MSEKPRKSATQIDEELAAFTDRLLSDQPVEESGVNPELDALDATLFQLKAVVDDAAVEQAAMQRIEKQLLNEWNKEHASRPKENAWQRYLPGSRPRKNQQWPAWVFAFGVVLVAIILIVLFPINQIFTSNIQATAGSAHQDLIIVVGFVVLLGVGLLWFGRKRP